MDKLVCPCLLFSGRTRTIRLSGLSMPPVCRGYRFTRMGGSITLKVKISASILAANPARFGEDIKSVEDAGVDFIHVDVMDGHFVPNLTMGPFIVKGLKKVIRVPIDIHLMVQNPAQFLVPFADAARKGDFFTFHIETTNEPKELIALIRKAGLKPAVALNPVTAVQSVTEIIGLVDMILVMTVNPGYDGQSIIWNAVPKIKELRMIAPEGLDIKVDGGITKDTIEQVASNGANVFAAATAIFKADDPYQAVQDLRLGAEHGLKLFGLDP
ncbi:MAG TPA: ribulose-phosphate 3-epimerase [Candidatus Brocadiia bacterium]|nr:ribulose-phosphate 3-epimerase [Candidatus Brocadiales bacterium]